MTLSTFLLQTRKLKELLENTLGWDFQMNSAVSGMYGEEDDEVSVTVKTTIILASRVSLCPSLSNFLFSIRFLQFAPVVEMVDDLKF